MHGGAGRAIFDLLEHLEGILPDADICNARSLAEHREQIIALEIVCNQLYEFDCRIGPEMYSEIEKLALGYGMPPRSWEYLRELVDER